jgi:hypothetical protein
MRRLVMVGRGFSARRRYLMDEWRDAFVTELRLREVPGTQIGEALAEVDAHCTDSGQTPAEAFGDPVEYAGARAAELVVKRRSVPLRAAWISFAICASTLAVFVGADAVAQGTQAKLKLGELLTLVLAPPIIAAIATLALRPGGGRRAPVLVGIAGGIGVLVVAVPSTIWPQVVATLPRPLLLVTGAAVFAVVWWRLTSTDAFADRVIDPRSGREPFRIPRWLMLLVRFGLPAVLVVGAILLALVPHTPR